jgi:hypothetical protein
MKSKFYILKRLHEDLDPDEKPYYEYLANNAKQVDLITTYKSKAKRFLIEEVEKNGIYVHSTGWKFIKVNK